MGVYDSKDSEDVAYVYPYVSYSRILDLTNYATRRTRIIATCYI